MNNEIKPTGHVFVDLDGTLIGEKSEELQRDLFMLTINNAVPGFKGNIDNAYNAFSKSKYCYLIQFLGQCKKYKGHGTAYNFAQYLMSKNLLPGEDLDAYIRFAEEFIKLDAQHVGDIPVYSDSKDMLECIKGEGYKIYLYSNWFSKVQDAKLQVNGFAQYFDNQFTIENSFAKSSVKGWSDVLETANIDSSDFAIMIGNGSSDIVPKRFNIPSLIRRGSEAKAIQERGIIIDNLNEVLLFLKEQKQNKLK